MTVSIAKTGLKIANPRAFTSAILPESEDFIRIWPEARSEDFISKEFISKKLYMLGRE